MPMSLKRDADRFADAARSAGDDRHSSHRLSPLSVPAALMALAASLQVRARSALRAWPCLRAESLRQSSSANSLAAGGEERLAAADAELLERLEAIGGKAGRGDGDALDALRRISRPASRRSPARAISRGRSATGTRRRPRGPAPRRAAARSSGTGSDRDRRARACARGMPWKLSSSRSGSKSSASSWRARFARSASI